MVAQKQQVEFLIRPDGRVEFTVKGVKGRRCEDVARLFQSLGPTEKAENTGEYYERDVDTHVSGRSLGS
ncbi:MAG: DUF2997 domain-containing protein [Armatimonadota bacterium]|nr:DUF2997 domain-containing protein [Armatimonadota bacterium]